jgi:DNA processing protein
VNGDLDDDSYARAALTYLVEPADRWLGQLVGVHGAARALDAIRSGRLPGTLSSGRAMERALERWRMRLGELPTPDDVTGFRSSGIRLVCPGDPEWPGQLADLGDEQPYALWLRGNADLRFSCLRSVAIVGSRAASAYGSYVAAEFAASVAARGWGVVSGGAYGIDASAHQGALGADGVTVAVLACGVDVAYPTAHTELLNAVAAQGVIVSEWPPGRTVSRLRFLVRNRVIAALATGTLVVEAGERSGALNTARHARDLGRRLMAVPGPVTSDISAGCHQIIRDWQGVLVTSAADVIEHLSPVGGVEASAAAVAAGSVPAPADADGRPAAHRGAPPNRAGLPARAQARRRPASRRLAHPALNRDELDLESAQLLDAMPGRGGMATTRIAQRAGVTPNTAIRVLGGLASAGFIERCEEGWRLPRG